MKKILLTLTVTLTLLASVAALSQQGQAQPTLPTITLNINGVELSTEIAETGAQRFKGLSFRKTLAPNAGMLFVYPSEQQLTFTMRDTLLPLTIAFLSKDMVINEFHDMPVGPNQLFPSKKTAQFALEVNQGWFAKNGIAVGDRVTLR